VEGSLEPVDCAFSKTCAEADTCASKHTWAELYDEINQCVDSITLADLAEAYESMDILEYMI
jgi:DNA-binding IscR family transcriptional regulator